MLFEQRLRGGLLHSPDIIIPDALLPEQVFVEIQAETVVEWANQVTDVGQEREAQVRMFGEIPRPLKLEGEKSGTAAQQLHRPGDDADIFQLHIGPFDFIVTAAPTVDERFVSVPLFADQMVCLMPADHPLAGQAHVGYADFHRCNLIAHAENGRNRFYQAVLKLPYTPVDCPPRLNIVNSQYSSSMA